MSDSNRIESLTKIEEMLSKPGGRQALRYILNAASAIPFAGGAIAGAGALWGEKEQGSVNAEFKNWADLADEQLNKLIALIEQLQNSPSAACLALLLPEIIGRTPTEGEQIPIVLNPSTIEELQPYVKRGWILLQSTGSVCSMGANNRIGNHIEDLKRPWGMGNGFVLTVPSWNLPTG